MSLLLHPFANHYSTYLFLPPLPPLHLFSVLLFSSSSLFVLLPLLFPFLIVLPLSSFYSHCLLLFLSYLLIYSLSTPLPLFIISFSFSSHCLIFLFLSSSLSSPLPLSLLLCVFCAFYPPHCLLSLVLSSSLSSSLPLSLLTVSSSSFSPFPSPISSVFQISSLPHLLSFPPQHHSTHILLPPHLISIFISAISSPHQRLIGSKRQVRPLSTFYLSPPSIVSTHSTKATC